MSGGAGSVSSVCATCKAWLGLSRVHTDKELSDGVCPVRASTWCSQCGCYGHRSSECSEEMMWDRPRTLEELIPVDVRERYDIDTETMIQWTKPTMYDAEREIAEINTIEIRFREGQKDSKIREYMKQNKIVTVHKMDGNIQKLRAWAVSHGKKVRLVQE
jgi:hypothetical protein